MRCSLCVVCCGVLCLLRVVRWLVVVGCRSLFVLRCVLCVVCCLLLDLICVVCCLLLFDVCCLLSVRGRGERDCVCY